MDELKTVTYQTNLTLTNIETGEYEWSTKYEIKKRFRRSGAGW
jgi:PBP1b-binding outer membrane lipoprotein LpoB